MSATNPLWQYINIGLGYGLVQQAITWANADPDLCQQIASLGHNELMPT